MQIEIPPSSNGFSCQYPLINYPGEEDPNEELKQTLEDVVCKAQPRTNTLLGFLQNLGMDFLIDGHRSLIWEVQLGGLEKSIPV